MTKKYELEFGIIRIFDNILISELKEGILFDVESNRQLLHIGIEEFKGKPYGYISNRIFSYAVDPLVYRESANHTSLKAIAVVTNNQIGLKSAQLEQNFYKKNSFKVFTSYNDALTWMNRKLADF